MRIHRWRDIRFVRFARMSRWHRWRFHAWAWAVRGWWLIVRGPERP